MTYVESTINLKQYDSNLVVFPINKRLYFEGIKYDFYRKCLLPKDLPFEILRTDYLDITMVGRSDPKPRGKKKKFLCASYYGSYICDCETTKHSKMNYCYKPSCKICFHKGISRQVDRIAKKLLKIEKLEGKEFKLAHYTFNILEKNKNNSKYHFPIMDIDSFKRYKAKLIRVIKKYKMDGILIFHPYRKDFLLMKQGIQAVKKSPHFHFIGRGNIIDGGSFYRKYGFTYANITHRQWKKGKRATPYLDGIDNIRGVLKYNLSHSAVLSPRMKSYSYIGKFSSYWYCKENEVHEFIPKICEECGDNLHFLKNNRTTVNIDKLVKYVDRYKIIRDVEVDFLDVYVYDRRYITIEKGNIYEFLNDDYDLVYRDLSKKKVKKIKYYYDYVFKARLPVGTFDSKS